MSTPTVLNRAQLARAFAHGHAGLLGYAGLDILAGPYTLGAGETHDSLATVSDGVHLGLSLRQVHPTDTTSFFADALNGDGPVTHGLLVQAHVAAMHASKNVDWSSREVLARTYCDERLYFYDQDPADVATIFGRLFEPFAAGLAS